MRRNVTQIDQSVIHKRTPVVNSNDDRAPRTRRRDAGIARNRQNRMRRRHRIHVIELTARSLLTVIPTPVPTGNAQRAIRRPACHRFVSATKGFVGPDRPRHHGLAAGHRVGDCVECSPADLRRPIGPRVWAPATRTPPAQQQHPSKQDAQQQSAPMRTGAPNVGRRARGQLSHPTRGAPSRDCPPRLARWSTSRRHPGREPHQWQTLRPPASRAAT